MNSVTEHARVESGAELVGCGSILLFVGAWAVWGFGVGCLALGCVLAVMGVSMMHSRFISSGGSR